MDKFFSLFGKVILGALLLTLVLGAGYYIGHTKDIPGSISSTPSPTKEKATKKENKKAANTALETPTPTQAEKKTVSAGLWGKDTAFGPYTIQIPNGWSEKRETTQGIIDKLTISKDNYSLIIYQAAFGGGGCTYKGEPEQMMAQTFANYVDIAGKNAQFRRSWNEEQNQSTISYTICQKGNDTSYGSPTGFGAISAQSPKPAGAATLSEIDSMIASLQK